MPEKEIPTPILDDLEFAWYLSLWLSNVRLFVFKFKALSALKFAPFMVVSFVVFIFISLFAIIWLLLFIKFSWSE